MGILRDTIRSAIGADQVNNGFGGPNLPFLDRNRSSNSGSRRNRRSSVYRDEQQYATSTRPRPRSYENGYAEQDYPRDRSQRRQSVAYYDDNDTTLNRNHYQSPGYSEYVMPMRQGGSYEAPPYQQADRLHDPQCHDNRLMPQFSTRDMQLRNSSREQDFFRPLVLPQIAYGEGQPFLRGYSDNLAHYGIYETDFIALVDAVNVAILPNPENQIFQKGANIAGWFVPGAAGIGLTAGQIGVGIGAAVGHASSISRVLSTANMDVFLPRGVELCIGTTKDVDAEVGIVSNTNRGKTYGDSSPEARIDSYGNLVAPLSRILPPTSQNGRTDPIAMFARGLADRTSQKTLGKAEKDASKGKNKKLDALEGGLKWLMVRRASPDALAHWQRNLQQNDRGVSRQ
ncbi:hypothetical protein ACHAPV_010412 [Trichoderma viride]